MHTLPLQAICRTSNAGLDFGVVGRLVEGLGPAYPCNYVIPPPPGTLAEPYQPADNDTEPYDYYSTLAGTSTAVQPSAPGLVQVLTAPPPVYTVGWTRGDVVLQLINDGAFNTSSNALFQAGVDRWVSAALC